jgi:hypothetical protein
MDIHSPLKKFFGFSQFKGLQEEVIKSILQKKNTFVIMPTGGGFSVTLRPHHSKISFNSAFKAVPFFLTNN